MTEAVGDHRPAITAGDRVPTLFAHTMMFVALTAATFALGAYAGRNLPGVIGLVAFLVAFGCLIGMQVAARNRAVDATVGLLCAFGAVMGVAVAPTLVQYVHADPGAVWQAAGATALFIAGFGAAGYGTRRDLTLIARVSSWGLVALIVLGIVLLFLQVPGGALVYSVLSLILFAALTMYDFQRLRGLDDGLTAPLLAASIFLDILNVFLSFLQIFYNPHED